MTQRVFVIVHHDYDNPSWGPILATRELAEATLALMATDELEHWEIHEDPVLTDQPQRVTMHYAQYHHDGSLTTGTAEWWDYDAAVLPQNDRIAWAATADEALAAARGFRGNQSHRKENREP